MKRELRFWYAPCNFRDFVRRVTFALEEMSSGGGAPGVLLPFILHTDLFPQQLKLFVLPSGEILLL